MNKIFFPFLIYNHFLSLCEEKGYKKAFAICKEVKVLIKEYLWLEKADSCSLKCACFDLEDAYKRYFDILNFKIKIIEEVRKQN